MDVEVQKMLVTLWIFTEQMPKNMRITIISIVSHSVVFIQGLYCVFVDI